MKISLNWLKQYLDLPSGLDSKEIGLKLTMSTVEVDEIIDQGEKLKDVYIGRISKITKHPNADKLSVAEVEINRQKILQIVFGQRAEVKEGDLVPVAVAPCVLPTGIKIEKQKLRGVVSEGMLCLNSEFIVGGDDNLTYFPADTKPGTLVRDILGLNDVIYEIDNKSLTNRPDLWGHYGIARELAAIFNLKLKPLETVKLKSASKASLKVRVEDKINCQRYLAAAIGNITVEPSPFWLQNLLKSIGLRPINNVVDLTNYVMFELGQPLHAFDRRMVSKDTIVVRQSGQKQSFVTLDGEERQLVAEDLLIGDTEKPIAIAGVMGGQNSEVLDDTTEIILEVANFNPVGVRKTSQRLALRTEASMRFEKSLDPLMVEIAFKRFITLLLQLIPEAGLISKTLDENNFNFKETVIDLNLDFVQKRIGQPLEKKQVIGILESLAFGVKEQENGLKVTVPSFRATKDISRAEDLIEELARIYGYDLVKPQMPAVLMQPPEVNNKKVIEKKIKTLLVFGAGVTEVYNYSFTGKRNIDLLGLKTDNHLQLENYFSEEQKYLRQNLLENLLLNLESNSRFYKNFDLFELGRVFNVTQGGYRANRREEGNFLANQEKHLAGLSLSDAAFYKVKGIVEFLLDNLEIDYELTLPDNALPKYLNQHRSMLITANDQAVGVLGELSRKLTSQFSSREVGYWEINFNQLIKFASENKKFHAVPKFPGIIYDLAILVRYNILWQKIEQEVREASPLIKKVELFDIYQISKLGPDKKSLAFHIHFLDPKRTLTSEEAIAIRDKIAKNLTKKFGAEIR